MCTCSVSTLQNIVVDPFSGGAHRLDKLWSCLESCQVRFDVRILVDNPSAFDNRCPHNAVADHDVRSGQPEWNNQQTNQIGTHNAIMEQTVMLLNNKNIVGLYIYYLRTQHRSMVYIGLRLHYHSSSCNVRTTCITNR